MLPVFEGAIRRQSYTTFLKTANSPDELKRIILTRSIPKRITRILGQPSDKLLYSSGWDILFINKQISLFPKEGIYPGGLISEGTYDRGDLFISNLLGLYPRGHKPGGLITGTLRYLKHCFKSNVQVPREWSFTTQRI